MINTLSFQDAINDFRYARRGSALWELLAWLIEKSINLLPFDGLSTKVQERDRSLARVQEIPLESINILAGQYSDFTRFFQLSLRAGLAQELGAQITQPGQPGSSGQSPQVDVYIVNHTYYLINGRHDLAIAREMGQSTILAHILDFKHPHQVGSTPEELILNNEWLEFLETTHFDVLFPGIVLNLSFPGLYKTIKEHIAVHRHYMGLELRREVAYEEALKHWYESVYYPVIEAIEEHGILHEFQGLTETDLYLWVADHRLAIQKEIGWSIRPPVVTDSMANQMSPRLTQVVKRVRQRITDTLSPAIPIGPHEPIGLAHGDNCLFRDILVPLSGHKSSWEALQQAIFVAKMEGSRLNGLHVLANEEGINHPKVKAIGSRFEEQCLASHLSARMTQASGDISKAISDHSKPVDLIVVNLAHPPSSEIMSRSGSGFRSMVKRCGRPILAVPGQAEPLDQLLLAYDGSPKGNEALFLSAYLSFKWGIPLCVLTVLEKDRSNEISQDIARRYLVSHVVSATYLAHDGDVVDIILSVAHEQGSNLLIMGGYGFSPVVDTVFSSTVDQVLRKADLPVLICQ